MDPSSIGYVKMFRWIIYSLRYVIDTSLLSMDPLSIGVCRIVRMVYEIFVSECSLLSLDCVVVVELDCVVVVELDCVSD
jgi:hypothetical protein